MLASCWSMVDWAQGIEPAVVVNAASVRAPVIHYVCQMRRRSFWRAVTLCGAKIGVKELTGNKHVVGGWFLHIVQELCESRGGRPGLSVLTSLLVSVDVKLY